MPYRTTAAILIGVLRLSSKFDVPLLRTRALQHLATAFPTSLDALSLDEARDWSFDIPDPAQRLALTQVAYEVGALWALPIGLHKLSFLLTFEELYDGMLSGKSTGDDDSVKPGLQDVHRRLCLRTHNLHGRHCFSLTSFLLGQDSFNSPTPLCESPEVCAMTRYQWLTTTQRLALMSEPRINPFYIWGDHFWNPYRVQICPPCLKHDTQVYGASVQTLWDELPGIMDLPNWDQLLQMKREDLGQV